jgi:hypothetical protein
MNFCPGPLFKKSLSTIIAILAFLQFARAQSTEMLFNDHDSLMTIQTFGMPSFDEDHSPRDIIARKWGFRYDHVADCVVSKQLSASIDAHNNEVNCILIKMYGPDWEKKFEEQVKSEYKKDERIKKTISKLPSVIKVMNEFKQWKGAFFYSLEPDKNLEIYHVSINGRIIVDKEEGMFTFGKFIVDSKTLKVSVISDKVEKFFY